jgi:hypothetical protein
MSVSGLNALQIILASGFGGVKDLGHIPKSVSLLAALPESVSLVRASEHINFHLAEKSSDLVRSDTSIYRWIVETAPLIVTSPDYFLTASGVGAFQLLKKVPPPSQYAHLEFLRFPIKFVSSAASRTREPELWLSTVILHDEESVAEHINAGVHIDA